MKDGRWGVLQVFLRGNSQWWTWLRQHGLRLSFREWGCNAWCQSWIISLKNGMDVVNPHSTCVLPRSNHRKLSIFTTVKRHISHIQLNPAEKSTHHISQPLARMRAWWAPTKHGCCPAENETRRKCWRGHTTTSKRQSRKTLGQVLP